MTATERTVSLAAKRYLNLCAGRGYGEAAVLEGLALRDCPENLVTNIGNYFSGVTQDCRTNCKNQLVAFANETLGASIDKTFFAISWHPMMVIDDFASDNRNHHGILQNNCGDFVYFVEKHPTPQQSGGLRVRKMSITRESDDVFKVSIGGDAGDAYIGFAMSATNTVYIVAFDQTRHADMLMFILRPVTEGKLAPSAFAGVQTCTMPRLGARIAFGVSRRTLVIRKDAFDAMTAKWPEGTPFELPPLLGEWLGGPPEPNRPGFVVDLDAHEEFEE